jgi:hypothetical protein
MKKVRLNESDIENIVKKIIKEDMGENITDKYFTTKTISEVDDYGFENLIKEVYGHNIELAAEEENLYESSLQFNNVNGDMSRFSYRMKNLESFIESGSPYPGTILLLNDMVSKDILNSGNYIISYGG